jgi:hypothetical protein
MQVIYTILFCLGVLLLLGFLKWLLEPYSPHKWEYRNPYDRTCKKCGRNEQEECWADSYARHGMRCTGWWEVYREGDGSCEKKKNGVDKL